MAATSTRNPVRLYRFYNFFVSDYGEPFALCDQHKSMQPIPDQCLLNKIADDATEPCNRCEQERAKAADEGEV